MSRLLVMTALVLAPAIAIAAPPRSFAVDVTPASDWRAEALATTLAADLVDDRLVLAHAAPDLGVHLRLEPRGLRYELAATLRDELHKLARVTRDDRVETTLAPPSVRALALGFAGVAMLLANPFVL